MRPLDSWPRFCAELLKSARPETRYGVALTCLLALSVSPVLIFVRVFEPDSGPQVAMTRPAERRIGELWLVHETQIGRRGLGRHVTTLRV